MKYLDVTFKVILICALIFLSYKIFHGYKNFFLVNLDLIFHEAGHFIFIFFGDTLYVLGGTIFQILVPSSFVCYFLYQRDFFATGLFIWWLGENIVNISIYMSDSLKLVLPLLGNGGHDWNHLFAKWGVLAQAEHIGAVTFYIGIAIILLGLLWISVIVIKNFLKNDL